MWRFPKPQTFTRRRRRFSAGWGVEVKYCSNISSGSFPLSLSLCVWAHIIGFQNPEPVLSMMLGKSNPLVAWNGREWVVKGRKNKQKKTENQKSGGRESKNGRNLLTFPVYSESWICYQFFLLFFFIQHSTFVLKGNNGEIFEIKKFFLTPFASPQRTQS